MEFKYHVINFPFSSVMQWSFEIHRGCIILVCPFLLSISLKKNKKNKNLTIEVGQQALKPSRISECLNDTVWFNKLLRIEPKVRIYKRGVRPILTYAAETRSDTAKTRQILETAEMKTLRRIMNKTRLKKIRNRDIREKCEIQNIGDWVHRRRIEWNAHLSRMNEDRIVRRMRHNGRRSRGRPMKRWSDALESTEVQIPDPHKRKKKKKK